MKQTVRVSIFLTIFLMVVLALSGVEAKAQSAPVNACLSGAPERFPAPGVSTAPGQLAAFEKQFLAYLTTGGYKSWCPDKLIRDTGPFKEGVYYGTHPAVRVYYSPKLMQWLSGGRKGTIPDGATIIKEQYPPPAARYDGLKVADYPPAADWTVMIRDSKSAKDGWFWGEFFPGMKFDDDQFPFEYAGASYGLYCLRCHSTAVSQGTFSSLVNVQGFPGTPRVYPDDGSWKGAPMTSALHGPTSSVGLTLPVAPPADPKFLQLFTSIGNVSPDQVQRLPSETYDHTPAPGTGPGSYVSSTQCMSCHGALANNNPFGPVMFLGTQPPPKDPKVTSGANVSSYTEWRWSPMGLAGRDPIFFAQFENELSILKNSSLPNSDALVTQMRNGCLLCHGAMGKRQLDIDSGGQGDFQLSYLQLTDRTQPNFKHGALARDGISCAVCHRVQPDQAPPGVNPLQHFLDNSTTGAFPAAGPDTIFGPFADAKISKLPMQNAMAMTPQNSTYLPSSRMCGTCHTIDLPVTDSGKLALHSIEQATYLEWLNSAYQNEFGAPGPNAKLCQDCHMPGTFHNESKGISPVKLQEKIAIIQDQDYPVSDNQAPANQVKVRVRNNYSRHSFLGLNVFLLNMFNQFPDVLGVRKDDYMSGSTSVIGDTIQNFVQQAQQTTTRLDVTATAGPVQNVLPQQITANIKVTNLVGHRFPSGVGFRRAFLEVAVVQNDGSGDQVLWISGGTNSLGLIVDGRGQVLPSEFFTDYVGPDGKAVQAFQPHYQVVNAENQVQIYEELVQDVNGRFTTSFIRRDETVKDNRLNPLGWSKTGPAPASLNGRYLKATMPDGEAVNDPDYQNGKGADNIVYNIQLPPATDLSKCRIRVTMYNQSIPPYYLRDRFSGVPGGDATKRLYYLTSRLQLDGTESAGWKMKLAAASSIIRQK